MRYYSNPFDLAQAVLETKKNNNKNQGDIYQLNQMPTLVKYNLETILQTGKNIQDNTEKLELISEKLKALTMYIAISKLGTQGNIQNQNQILNNISKIVGPNLDKVKSLKDKCQKKIKGKQIKAHQELLCQSVVKYIDFMIENLTPHLFGY